MEIYIHLLDLTRNSSESKAVEADSQMRSNESDRKNSSLQLFLQTGTMWILTLNQKNKCVLQPDFRFWKARFAGKQCAQSRLVIRESKMQLYVPGRIRNCGPAIPAQRSNQLSYRGRLLSSNHKCMYTVCTRVRVLASLPSSRPFSNLDGLLKRRLLDSSLSWWRLLDG